MKKIYAIAATMAVASIQGLDARQVAYFPMELSAGKVTETISGTAADVVAATTPESIEGTAGNAVRFDGYSNYIQTSLTQGSLPKMTFSLQCAMETYPIIEHDVQNETDAACIAGNYDSNSRTGFGFFITRTGKVSFRFYSMNWPGEISAATPLPLYQWNCLAASSDGTNVSFYVNGTLAGSAKCKGLDTGGTFMIGKAREQRTLGSFHTNTVNGIIDEIELLDTPTDAATIASWQCDRQPRLSETAENKYEDDILRPLFHGMPSRNWTNETHGLVYYGGRYHLFFQKNANGPYMSRLQWGHLVSEDLCTWTELPIALGSDQWYDLKGCWSGCIAVDDEVTAGTPNIIYTGVDYARAMIAQAAPADDDLLGWTKQSAPIINGRPQGLSDDFRDPYFFRNGEDAYIIVGTSKDGKGACTLHKYNPTTRSWSNDGKIFFSSSSATLQGRFWEMPAVVTMDGRTFFTATPQGLSDGVKALYWTGSIASDGTFSPSSGHSTIELPGFAKDGFGLLSPTIMQHQGKTIALGIVPDKLPGAQNYAMGWAHTYSLPREWSLDANGKLIQKPYAGLDAMRDAAAASTLTANLNGSLALGTMPSRCFELEGYFTVGHAAFGFSFFKNGSREAKLYYDPATGKLTFDIRTLERIANDNGVFDGLYASTLPERVAAGSVMKLRVFVDRSIADIFINDKWATSVRLFPTDAEANDIEVFSQGGTTSATATLYPLDPASAGLEIIPVVDTFSGAAGPVTVYNLAGIPVRTAATEAEATAGLPAGFYLTAGKKILIP